MLMRVAVCAPKCCTWCQAQLAAISCAPYHQHSLCSKYAEARVARRWEWVFTYFSAALETQHWGWDSHVPNIVNTSIRHTCMLYQTLSRGGNNAPAAFAAATPECGLSTSHSGAVVLCSFWINGTMMAAHCDQVVPVHDC